MGRAWRHDNGRTLRRFTAGRGSRAKCRRIAYETRSWDSFTGFVIMMESGELIGRHRTRGSVWWFFHACADFDRVFWTVAEWLELEPKAANKITRFDHLLFSQEKHHQNPREAHVEVTAALPHKHHLVIIHVGDRQTRSSSSMARQLAPKATCDKILLSPSFWEKGFFVV